MIECETLKCIKLATEIVLNQLSFLKMNKSLKINIFLNDERLGNVAPNPAL